MKVIIATQAYNAENYLAQTVETVLKQTYTDFIYLLIDSASTDSTPQIMQEYAKKDNRIKYIHFDVNALGRCEQCAVKEDGDYYMALDSDDLLEPNCLERLVEIAIKTDVDVVVTGTRLFDDSTNETISERKYQHPALIEKKDYAMYYRYYHWDFRRIWAKLYKTEVLKKVDVEKIVSSPLVYGKDTWFAFQALRCAEKFYIDNSCLHHYRIRQSSVSHKYKSVQHDSDILLYNDAVDFLNGFGEISSENMGFIYLVYINACKDNLINLFKSELSPDEKISECLRVVSNEVTQKSLLQNIKERDELKEVIRALINQNAAKVSIQLKEKLEALINAFLVECKALFTTEFMPLFVVRPEIWDLLIRDQRSELLESVWALITENVGLSKSLNLSVFLQKIIPEDALVSDIANDDFFYNYPEICKSAVDLEYIEALDRMTEIMLSGNELEYPEEFLTLYIKLAVLENHVEAFLFGNIQKAYLYIDEERLDEAKALVNDLVEMGAQESEAVKAILQEIENKK